MANGMRKTRGHLKWILCAAALMLLLVAAFLPVRGLLDSAYRAAGIAARPTEMEGDVLVHFIDVGQADCTLIQAGEKTVLIDAGLADTQRRVLDYLKAQGVLRIDLAVITHPHADHFGGMQFLAENLPVELALVCGGAAEGEEQADYEQLLAALDRLSVPVQTAAPRTQYTLSEDTAFFIMGPLSGDHENPNNLSVVAKLQHGDVAFLFPGDAETESENELAAAYGGQLQAQVLKLGHHGSKTSTQEKWLSAVQPDYAVASVGADGGYGHPHADVIKRLQSRGILLLRTDRDGTVVVASDGTSVSYLCEKQQKTNDSADLFKLRL